MSPTSSSTVKRSSSGPWTASFESMSESAAASPMPLSEPSVVPFALSHSPWNSSWIGSFEKSCATSEFFSPTMSMCPWSTIVGRVLLAGGRRDPDHDVSGRVLLDLEVLALSRTRRGTRRASPRCPEQWGMLLILSKCFQTYSSVPGRSKTWPSTSSNIESHARIIYYMAIRGSGQVAERAAVHVRRAHAWTRPRSR